MNIRVLVVDDFPLAREGLSAALEVDPTFEVIGEARATGNRAWRWRCSGGRTSS